MPGSLFSNLSDEGERRQLLYTSSSSCLCCRFKKQSKKIPGKGGQRFWKNVGLGFKTPKEAMEGACCLRSTAEAVSAEGESI
jgi:hypothetical protein